MRAVLLTILPPVLGIALFIGLWSLVSMTSPQLPSPAKTWTSAVDVFSDPFYRKGPNDQGIGWNVLMSLQRVGIGFGLAALIGIPLGFILGRFAFRERDGVADHQPAAAGVAARVAADRAHGVQGGESRRRSG